MKRWLIRPASLVLAAAILSGPVSGASVQWQSGLALADALTLHSAGTLLEDSVREHTLVYTPGGDVRPMVVYGDTLYGRSTMDYVERYLQKAGYTAVAAINAAFFDMSNGLPIGMVATEGILRSSGDGLCVGVAENGAVRIGRPELQVLGEWGENRIPLHYNQLLTGSNGIVLYSRDYDEKVKGGVEGYHVVLRADRGQLGLEDTLTATVSKIVDGAKTCAIPEDGFVLSLTAKDAYGPFQEAVESLAVGDQVKLSTHVASDWRDVSYAVGGGDMLVEGGQCAGSFSLDSAQRKAPRTALGLKDNGDVVVFTADRGSGSAGLTLAELAERMQELGCETAVNLDGGGSTCLGATLPGQGRFSTVNQPSDGGQRPSANYIFFVRPTVVAGPAARLHVYPYDAAMLPGGRLELSVTATDSSYMAARVPGGVNWSADQGTVSQGIFQPSQPGLAVVSARAGSLYGSTSVRVVETPTAMQVLRQDQEKEVEALLVESGQLLDLTARAQYYGQELLVQDPSFTWSVTGEIGQVDQEGLFTAGPVESHGTVGIRCGQLEQEIPVEVRINPMIDLQGHWAREAISNLYFRGILNGGEDGAGNLVYRPDASMTRQEFLAALLRWMGVETSAYQGEKLPFADEKAIAPWALEGMKAAYALGLVTGSQRGGKLYLDPNETITREAAMTILARTIGASSDGDALEQFPDYGAVSSWAKAGLTAMVERGVIQGMDGKLQPQGVITRAQAAKLFYSMS